MTGLDVYFKLYEAVETAKSSSFPYKQLIVSNLKQTLTQIFENLDIEEKTLATEKIKNEFRNHSAKTLES